MFSAFVTGGFGMYPTLAFGLLSLAAAALFAVRPERRFVPLVVSSSLLTLAAGALGFVMGVVNSFQAVLEAPDRGMAMVGVGESGYCLALALIFVVLTLIATTAGSVRIARAPA
jgi:hypothetical protein